MANFYQRIRDEHAAEVEQGLHDEVCEYRVDGFYICNCSMRKRVAEGYTEPPGELIYQNPLCPRCYTEVGHDGDSYVCVPCKASWSSSDHGHGATFTDDHGSLDVEQWEAGRAARLARGVVTE